MAQVIKKRNIVIASVLKPVNDTRMFEKIGQSLADSGDYVVHIIGFPSLKSSHYPRVYQHPNRHFKRLSVYRFIIPWLIFFRIKRLKPDILIIATHELLLVGFLIKLFSGIRLIYDVQENYYRNILYMNSFPAFVKPLLAAYVRMKEICLSGFVDHFFLSETGYKEELPFLKNRFTILENKIKRSSIPKKTESRKKDRFLFSGTLSESTGVFVAIRLAELLHAINPSVQLTIIGYCSTAETLERIHKSIATNRFIKLIGGDRLVPHAEIMNAIQESDVGIISYLPNKATENKMPTKLYEYLGCRLPVLLINHVPWMKICEPYAAAVVFDSSSIDAKRLCAELKTKKFYTAPPSEDVYWESEVGKLMEIIARPHPSVP